MHTCNAYCRDGLHCDLYHVSPAVSEARVAQAVSYYAGLKVRRVEPAREPGPLTGAEPLIVGDRDSATRPWLVWWED